MSAFQNSNLAQAWLVLLLAAGFGVRGETVRAAEDLAPAILRGLETMREGRPYLIDAVVGRTGIRADSTWYPRYSVAAARSRRV